MRVLPQQLDAEASIVSTCLADDSGKAAENALLLLRPEHFSSDAMRLIFTAIGSCHEQGLPCDWLTVAREMERDHALSKLRSPDYGGFVPPDEDARQQLRDEAGRELLRSLAAEVPVITRIPFHARLVIEAWGKRLCIEAFTKPMQGAWNGASPFQVIRQVEDACQHLHSQVIDEGDSQVVGAFEAVREAHERVQNGQSFEGAVPPPFAFLDDLIPGRLYILGGYAKDGKTVVGSQAAITACKAGVKTGIATIEMSRTDLMLRLIASFGVPYKALQRGYVGPEHKAAYDLALNEIANWPLDIYDNPAATVADIARFVKLGHHKFLVVDHLHRINYEDARDPRLKLGQNVKQLAILARTAHIPILLLAQLHRAGTLSDAFPRPTMQSFKESSTIEQEASALWAVYRKRNPDTGEREQTADFLVLADRFGEDSLDKLHFQGTYQRFSPMDWRHAT